MAASVGRPVATPYRVHDQFYASMLRDNDNHSSSREEDSFLGARMQFPKPLARHQSHCLQPPSSQSSEREQRQPSPSKYRNSLNDRRSMSSRDNLAVKSKSRQGAPILQEDMELKQFYLEAKRHQAVTARVTNLEDFQTMSFTLPAAKTSSSSMTSRSKHDICFPFKQCPMMGVLTTSSTHNQRRRIGESMFRGKKTWTSSAAAGSVIAEASQADRYYYTTSTTTGSSKTKKNCGQTQTSSRSHPSCVLDHQIQQDVENKRRWTSRLVPKKKWTSSHRSLAVEV